MNDMMADYVKTQKRQGFLPFDDTLYFAKLSEQYPNNPQRQWIYADIFLDSCKHLLYPVAVMRIEQRIQELQQQSGYFDEI